MYNAFVIFGVLNPTECVQGANKNRGKEISRNGFFVFTNNCIFEFAFLCHQLGKNPENITCATTIIRSQAKKSLIGFSARRELTYLGIFEHLSFSRIASARGSLTTALIFGSFTQQRVTLLSIFFGIHNGVPFRFWEPIGFRLHVCIDITVYLSRSLHSCLIVNT